MRAGLVVYCENSVVLRLVLTPTRAMIHVDRLLLQLSNPTGPLIRRQVPSLNLAESRRHIYVTSKFWLSALIRGARPDPTLNGRVFSSAHLESQIFKQQLPPLAVSRIESNMIVLEPSKNLDIQPHKDSGLVDLNRPKARGCGGAVGQSQRFMRIMQCNMFRW